MKNPLTKNTSPFIEYKDTDKAVTSVVDVDDKSRRVKIAISKMGNLDLDNDVIEKGAFNKTIKERGPKGANLIWHLTDHYASLKNAVGKFTDLFVEGDFLMGITDVPPTTWGNDVLAFYKSGHINQHSIGFRTIKAEPAEAGTAKEHRVIKEVLLYEGSAVLWGANPETPTISVGKSLTLEESQAEIAAALKEVNNLAKMFKTGDLSDQSYELLEIRLKQSTDKLQQLFDLHTQPAKNAVEPSQGEELLDVLKTFNNSLTLSHDSRRISEAIASAIG